MTPLSAAGYMTGLPLSPSFPVAATHGDVLVQGVLDRSGADVGVAGSGERHVDDVGAVVGRPDDAAGDGGGRAAAVVADPHRHDLGGRGHAGAAHAVLRPGGDRRRRRRSRARGAGAADDVAPGRTATEEVLVLDGRRASRGRRRPAPRRGSGPRRRAPGWPPAGRWCPSRVVARLRRAGRSTAGRRRRRRARPRAVGRRVRRRGRHGRRSRPRTRRRRP